jgi:hypothetical protein
MATVTSLTLDRILQLLDGAVEGGTVNSLGNLILTTKGGASIDAGSITLPGGNTGQFYRGDKTWADLNKAVVGLSLVDNVSVIADYVPKWKTGAVYAIGDLAITPTNLVVKALVAHTAGASYAADILKWDEGPLPKGLLYVQMVPSSTGQISGTTPVVVNNVPTFTFKANRWYEITWDFSYYCSVANAYPQFLITTCSTADAAALATGLTSIRFLTLSTPIAGNSEGGTVRRRIKYTTDTTLQIKFCSLISAGGGSVVITSAADSPVQYAITDLGLTGA